MKEAFTGVGKIINSDFLAIVDEAVLEIDWMTFSAGKLNLGIGMPSSKLIELIQDPRIAQIRSTSNN